MLYNMPELLCYRIYLKRILILTIIYNMSRVQTQFPPKTMSGEQQQLSKLEYENEIHVHLS